MGTPLLTAGALALAVWAMAAATWAAWVQGTTYDEPSHLAWSERLLDERLTERTSDPRFDSKTPVSLLNVLAQRAARRLGFEDERALLFAARLANVVWLGVLLAAAYILARRVAGPSAGALAVVLLALDPNLSAHASLVTVDLPYAVATLLTLGAALRFNARPGPAEGARLGAALGLAFAIKFSAVLLVACVLLLPLARGRGWAWNGRRVLQGLVVAGLVCVLTIDVAYLFAGVGAPLAGARWRSGTLARLAAALPGLRLPLPLDFVTGLDILIDAERNPPWHSQWNVVVLGQVRPGGVWYYFVLHWLFKTPVLVLAALASGLWMTGRAVMAAPAVRFLAVALIVHLAYFSLLFRTQVGYRFALMCVPLAAILAARGLAERMTSRAAAVVVAVTAVETIPYWGDPLSFTNALVQPKRLAYRFVADSNLDWGQNDDRVREEVAGRTGYVVDPLEIVPGGNVISGNLLAGVVQPERFRWVRDHLQPERHLRHTHFVFDVTLAQYGAFVDAEHKFASRPLDATLCPDAATAVVIDGRGPARFEAYEPGTLPLVCIHAKETTDVVLQATAGVAVVTPAGHPPKSGRRVLEGESLVFRLPPGPHAFVVGRHKGFGGHWTVSAPVTFNVQPRRVEELSVD